MNKTEYITRTSFTGIVYDYFENTYFSTKTSKNLLFYKRIDGIKVKTSLKTDVRGKEEHFILFDITILHEVLAWQQIRKFETASEIP